MTISLKCYYCNTTISISKVFCKTSIRCCNCGRTTNITTELVQVKDKNEPIPQTFSTFKNGESVIVNNKEHPWNGQIALVCGLKHKFVRIELLNKRLWIPTEWIKQYDSY